LTFALSISAGLWSSTAERKKGQSFIVMKTKHLGGGDLCWESHDEHRPAHNLVQAGAGKIAHRKEGKLNGFIGSGLKMVQTEVTTEVLIGEGSQSTF